MNPTERKPRKNNPASPQQTSSDGLEEAHSRPSENTLKLGIGRHLAAVGQLSNQLFKKLRSRLQTKLNTLHGLETSNSDANRLEDPGEIKIKRSISLEVQEISSLSSLKSVSLSSSSHGKSSGGKTIPGAQLDSTHLPRTKPRFIPGYYDEIPLHDDPDLQFRRELSKNKDQLDATGVYVHQRQSFAPQDAGATNQFLDTKSDRKTHNEQRVNEYLFLDSDESVGKLLPNEQTTRFVRGGGPAFVFNERHSSQSNDLSLNIQDTGHSTAISECSSTEMPEVRALHVSNALKTNEAREGCSLLNQSFQHHTFKGNHPFPGVQKITGFKLDGVNKYTIDKYVIDSEISSAKQRSVILRSNKTNQTQQIVAQTISEKQHTDEMNSHLRGLSNNIPAPGPTTSSHIAVPVSSKDAHKAIKNVIRYHRANEEIQQLAPAETVFPKSTIIFDRAQTGSPYFKHDPLPDYQATPVKSYTHDANRMISPTFEQYSVSNFLPRRPAPTAPLLRSTLSHHPGPPRSYTTPYQQSYLSAPAPLPLPPQGVHFQSNYYAMSRSSPAPKMIHRNNGSVAEWHPTPTAPLESNEPDYSRLRSSRSSTAPTSWYETLISMLEFKSSRYKEEPPAHRMSFTPSEHRSSRRSFQDRGFTRTRESTPAPSVRFNQRTTSDDLILQMACCCWPIGLAARIIMILVPSHQASCLTLIARQLSIYALLLGIAVYLFVMVTIIALLLALVKERS